MLDYFSATWDKDVLVCDFRSGVTHVTLKELVDGYEPVYTYFAKFNMLWPAYDEETGLLLVTSKKSCDELLTRVCVPHDEEWRTNMTKVSVRDRDIYSDYDYADCQWTTFPWFHRVDSSTWFFPSRKNRNFVHVPYMGNPGEVLQMVYPPEHEPKPLVD